MWHPLCLSPTVEDTCFYSQRWRETSEEKRDIERLQEDMVNDVRKSAEVHRQVAMCTAHLHGTDECSLDAFSRSVGST